MRILVISDTHIPGAANTLPPIIEEEAKRSDCCFHAGDFVSLEVFKQISSWTKVYGVCGNMDEPPIRIELPHKQVIELEQIKVGLIHGKGSPEGIVDYVNREFAEEFYDIDIFVFGHSHKICDEEKNGKIYFNPGSVNDKMFALYNSYGILEINGKKITRGIVKIG
jgi:putative phosphoesterase